MNPENKVSSTIDHLFRRESGRVIGALVKRFGSEHIDLAEDVLQDVLLKALQEWPQRGMPQRPVDWIIMAAHNLAVDHLRKRSIRLKHGPRMAEHLVILGDEPPILPYSAHEMEDDLLRVIFTCCHPDLSAPSQIALVLRLVMGIDVDRIAHAMDSGPAATLKRLARAKASIRDGTIALEVPAAGEINERLGRVLNALYLIFAIGLRQQKNQQFGKEICDDAIRSIRVILNSSWIDDPRCEALLALMLFRSISRWKMEVVRNDAEEMLLRSARGNTISRYHLEAAIAEQFSREPSMIDHKEILQLYEVLYLMDPTESIAKALEEVRSRIG